MFELSEQEARLVVQSLSERQRVFLGPGLPMRLQPEDGDEYWALRQRLMLELAYREELAKAWDAGWESGCHRDTRYTKEQCLARNPNPWKAKP